MMLGTKERPLSVGRTLKLLRATVVVSSSPRDPLRGRGFRKSRGMIDGES